MARLSWAPIVARAAEIVESYDIPVTLRQLFYRLVMEQLLPNTQTAYKSLSAETTKLRRRDEFPRLFDRGRKIYQPVWFDDPGDAMRALIAQYRLDRTALQDTSVFLGVEKNALAGLLQAWFDDSGLPVLPLGGYSSESLDRLVRERVEADGRPAVLIYAGDFDPSGMDIGRNFIAQTDCWKQTIRIGLDEALIERYELPVLEGKATDPRAPKFIDEHPDIHARHNYGRDAKGRRIPVQVELDAVDPAELRALFQAAINQFWDTSGFEAMVRQEDADRAQLETAMRVMEAGQ
ncbi:hypothetical protein [Streptacidiphilus melanogenes]|uniref:hypothetical protein n=1 Tax=Streptacidiphilus melanogenes TaxID=411235 RepID=UPI0005A65736|nr:hypothetical protein [Streptacidiphilus melanogenes]